MIKVILWDLDCTLLDFPAAERNAILSCFSKFNLGECTDDMVRRYSALNKSYWARLEKGEISKPQLLRERFEVFFSAEGLDPSLAGVFNQEYQLRLGDTICFIDHGYELVEELRGRVKQYAVTNGTYTAQKRKLERSGLDRLFDGVFISDEVGAEKPSKAFFDYVLDRIGPYEKDEILIVGDSLSSDMRGGCQAGIRCCWYNPGGEPLPGWLEQAFNIQNLNQVRDILAQN